jgi:hypothetical protein
MKIRSSGLGCAIALASAVTGPAARADDAIGQVKKASGMVRVVHQDGKNDPVKVGDHVRQSDVIKTDKASLVGITFLDNSMMSLGPSSELALTEFSFNSTTREGKFNTQLNKGTLRVKSGQIVQQTPEAMKIRTPAALLGVRGTEFVVDAGQG